MIHSGLKKIAPKRKDYSLLHTFGALNFDTKGLPANFSIFDGRSIPDQNSMDSRFTPALPPIPFGCTGETGAFECGIVDGKMYNPKELFDNTTPYDPTQGRDIRAMLQRLIDLGPLDPDGIRGPKRKAYFNCYGAGKISDFDAVRIALWINQNEKRGVYVGSYWYPEFENPLSGGSLSAPSFDISAATAHCHLVTGWRTLPNGTIELEDISWQGDNYASAGLDYISAAIYNGLMKQPWTGAFTITKLDGNAPIPIGYQAVIDHLVYFIRNLFKL